MKNLSKRLLSLVLAVALLCSFMVMPAHAEESSTVSGGGTLTTGTTLSGSGTEENPYQISSLEDLILFRDSVNAGETTYNAAGVYVALTADIDMASVDWSVNIGDDCSFTFDGIFDGQNHTIKNLNSTETAAKADGYVCTGLFGAIYGSAVVKNLTIENVDINTGDFEGNNAAAVVAFAYSCTGSIENVKVTGNIRINAKGITGTGVIVGYDYYSPSLTVKNCVVDGSEGSAVIGASYVGAVIGYASNKILVTENTVQNMAVTATGGAAGGVAGILLAGGSITCNTVSNVAVAAEHANWLNSAAAVIGCVTPGTITVSGNTLESVTANGTVTNTVVGCLHADKPGEPIPGFVAQVGQMPYNSLEAAIDAAIEGDTVTLLKNTTLANAITINSGIAVTLDLNGNTITAEKGAFILNNGTLTVKSGTINAADDAFVVDTTGASSTDVTATLNIEEGTTVCSTDDCCVYIKGNGAVLNTAGNLTSNGTGYAAIQGNGMYGGITVNVTGGTISSKCEGIYFPSTTELTISGGTITGTTGVYHKSGKLTISGGTIIGNGPKVDYVYNSNGCNATGDALVIEACDYPGGVPTVSITGGTFKSENASAIGSYAQSNEYAATITISGGYYSSDPTKIGFTYPDDEITYVCHYVDNEEHAVAYGMYMVHPEGYTSLDYITHPTCTTPGVGIKRCAWCGIIVDDNVVVDPMPTRHVLEHVDATPATCAEAGILEHYRCTECEKTFADKYGEEELTSIVDPATSHALTHVEPKAATCTANGINEHYVCGTCGKLFNDPAGLSEITEQQATQNINPDAHSYYEEWVPVDNESHYHVCANCGDKKDQTAHTFNEVVDDGAYYIEGNDCVIFYWKSCECGKSTAFTGTENENGETVIDEDSIYFVVAKTDAVHAWNEGAVITAPTCTEDGVKTYTCTNKGCTATKTETVTHSGHTEVVIPGKAATCTEDGLTDGKKCSVCGTVTVEQTEIPAAGHKGGEATCEKPAVCEVCGKEYGTSSVSHTLSPVDAKAPTCTEAGNIEYACCSICGKNFSADEKQEELSTVTVPATGHTEVAVPGKAATCTETGLTDGKKCSVCDTVTVEQKTVEALGHKLDQVPASAATYFAAGNIEHSKCSVCGKLFNAAGKELSAADVVIAQLVKVEETKAEVSTGVVDNAIEDAKTEGTVNIVINVTSDKLAEKEPSEDDSTGETTPDEKPEAPVVTKTELPVASVEQVAELHEEATLTVAMTNATVTMDKTTLEVVAEAAKTEGSSTIALEIEHIETEALAPAQQEAVADKEVAAVISASILVNETEVHDFQGGEVTVAIPFTPAEGTNGSDYVVLYIADDGTVEEIPTAYENGVLTMTLSHFSEYVVVNANVTSTPPVTPPSQPDVPATGDDTNVMMLVSMLVLSLCGMAVIILNKKKFLA